MEPWGGFRQQYEDLFRFAYRMLGSHESAEDVAQESFLRLAQNGLERRQGERPRRWLFVVARNLCWDRLRSHTRHGEVPLDECAEPPCPTPGPEEAMHKRELSALVEKAVVQLPPPLREVIVLREYEEMDYAQIASLTESSLGSVKSRLARAREAIRKQLEPILEESR